MKVQFTDTVITSVLMATIEEHHTPTTTEIEIIGTEIGIEIEIEGALIRGGMHKHTDKILISS